MEKRRKEDMKERRKEKRSVDKKAPRRVSGGVRGMLVLYPTDMFGAVIQRLLETGFDGFGFFLVAGFCKEGKHVALVGFHAGLVEGIDTEDVAADAASFLEEVDELAEIFLLDSGDGHEDVGHSAVNVGDAGTEFSHLVYFVDVFAGDVVEAVEVCLVAGDEFLVGALLN